MDYDRSRKCYLSELAQSSARQIFEAGLTREGEGKSQHREIRVAGISFEDSILFITLLGEYLIETSERESREKKGMVAIIAENLRSLPVNYVEKGDEKTNNPDFYQLDLSAFFNPDGSPALKKF